MTNGQARLIAICCKARVQMRVELMTNAARAHENRWRGARNRILQTLAREAAGAETTRVRLHRARGVNIGANVWIGYDVILDTGFPGLITIEDNAVLSVRVTVIAHMWDVAGVTIERDAYLGAGVIVLPSVVVGRGTVVTAGSVVSRSIPELTLAQGNPATPIAKLSTPFRRDMAQTEFYRSMRPLR
jgi:acetyltransferase-like isoleucine patch superfamily enzyme